MTVGVHIAADKETGISSSGNTGGNEGLEDVEYVGLCVCVCVLFSPAFFGPFNESLVERCILRNGLNDAVVCGHMTNSPMTHSCGAETEDVAMTKKKQIQIIVLDHRSG